MGRDRNCVPREACRAHRLVTSDLRSPRVARSFWRVSIRPDLAKKAPLTPLFSRRSRPVASRRPGDSTCTLWWPLSNLGDRTWGGPGKKVRANRGIPRGQKLHWDALSPLMSALGCPLPIESCRASAQDPPRICPALFEPSIWGAGPRPRPGGPRGVRFASDFKGLELGVFPPSPDLLRREPGPDRHMEGSNNTGQVLRAGLAPEGSESGRLGR